MELRRALLVAPVANPDEISFAGCRRARIETAHVGGLVPRPCAGRPAVGEIRIANHVAEREHAVVVRQVVAGDGRRVGHRPVVRVVEEQHVRACQPRWCAPIGRDERVVVPLVHEHEIGAGQRRVRSRRRRLVPRADAGQFRDRPARTPASAASPCSSIRLTTLHASRGSYTRTSCPRADELRRDAAEEVRVAVVPVRQQRVAEDHDAHDEASIGAGARARSRPSYRRS